MRVSVVSASYNHAKILPRMYEQVMAQKNLIHEWIICDDGSLDGTFSLIKKYSRDPMISGYWQTNEGNRLGASVNNGLRRATGDVIFIILGDTYLQPNTMKNVHDFYIPGSAGSGLKQNVNFDGTFHSWEWRYREDWFKKTILLEKDAFCKLTGNVMLVDRDAFREIDYYNEEYGGGYGRDDWSVFLRLERIGVPLYQYNMIIADHVYHGEGQSDHPKNLKIFEREYETYHRT